MPDSPSPSPAQTPLCMAAVVVAALGVAGRFALLGRHPLTPDESVTWSLATQRDVLGAICSRAYGEAPLIHVLVGFLTAWTTVPGALRALPALFGCATVLVALMMFRRWLSPVGAFLGTLFVSLSAFQIYYSQELRAYSLVTLLTLGMLALYLEWLRNDGLPAWGWILMSILPAACVYAHYLTALFLTALATLVPVLPVYRRHWRVWFFTQLLAAALFLPWIGSLRSYSGMIDAARQVIDFRWMRDLAAPLVLLPFGKSLIPHPSHPGYYVEGAVLGGVAMCTGLWLLSGAWALLRPVAENPGAEPSSSPGVRREMGIVLGTALLVPLALLWAICTFVIQNYNYVYVRYVIWLYWPCVLLGAFGLEFCWARGRRWVVVGATALWLTGNSWNLANYFGDPEYLKGPDFPGAAQRLSRGVRPGDRLLCDGLFTYQPLRCYALRDPALAPLELGMLEELGARATRAHVDSGAIYPATAPVVDLAPGRDWIILYHDWRARGEAGFEKTWRDNRGRIERAVQRGDYIEEERWTVRGLEVVLVRRSR